MSEEQVTLIAETTLTTSDRSQSEKAFVVTEKPKLLQKSRTTDATNGTVVSQSTKSAGNKKRRKKKRTTELTPLIKAILVRIMFAAHASIAFSRVMLSAANTLDDVSMPWWMPYSNIIGLVLLFFETFITLYKRGGEDYKYFCPSVFFYLISIIPSMVMLEFDQFYQLQRSDCQDTEPAVELRQRRDVLSINVNSSDLDAFSTTTSKAAVPTPSSTPPLIGDHRFKDDALDVLHDINFNLKEGIANSGELIRDLTSNFDEGVWILGLHQVLLFFLVLGRWMLPRGGISREQLSQLLLVFIGTGADILEFVSETIEEGDPSECSAILHYMIWSVWAWSLMQFNFVLTASTARKQDVATTSDNTRRDTEQCCGSCCQGFFQNPDVWGMLMTLFIQDLPFCVARCYFIFQLGIRSQMMIFFTLKNLLVVMLQLYRLKVLWQTRKEYFTRGH